MSHKWTYAPHVTQMDIRTTYAPHVLFATKWTTYACPICYKMDMLDKRMSYLPQNGHSLTYSSALQLSHYVFFAADWLAFSDSHYYRDYNLAQSL